MNPVLPTNTDDLCYLPATHQAALIRSRALSSTELLQAYLDRISRVNPAINAIVTLDEEGARKQAQTADSVAPENMKPLHGLVLAHKDLLPTRGMRTTFGSRLHEHFVPDVDASAAVRMREAGAIRLGKTNVPEMGAGSHSFNPVFGATRNPYNQSRTAGGSSGGAGAALAAGLLSLADGSDMGGSLRNPGSFNNVVGFRPSVGRVSRAPLVTAWFNLSVLGPLGRTVDDAALLLSVLAGHDPYDPSTIPGDGSEFQTFTQEPPLESLRDFRIGWSENLGGLPFAQDVLDVLATSGRPTLESLGAQLQDVEPDFEGAETGFKRLRFWQTSQNNLAFYQKDPESLSANVRYDVEQGLKLTPTDIYEAHTARTRLHNRFVELFQTIDILACPTVQLPPFPVHWMWPREVGGEWQSDYLGWMRSCWYVSATGFPAISIPCGFTEDGLPVGIQLVGRNYDELTILRVAKAFENANPVWKQRPVLN